MAQLSIDQIHDGARNAVFHISILGDGTGDLDKQVIVDPAADFDPPLPPTPALRLTHIWYDLGGFSASLHYDYLSSERPLWSMSPNGAADMDFLIFGGLTDRSPVLDGSGQVLLTTSGLISGLEGSIVIALKKS